MTLKQLILSDYHRICPGKGMAQCVKDSSLQHRSRTIPGPLCVIIVNRDTMIGANCNLSQGVNIGNPWHPDFL